jgi:phosphoribosylanthranilate isomerase
MPSGPGVIPEAQIAQIAADIPPTIESVLLTSLQDTDAITAQHRRCRTSAIQLCNRLTRGTHKDLRAALPEISLVQVVHVCGKAAIEEARSVARHVHAILLDSGTLARDAEQLGGTGRTHDWSISRRIRETVKTPVILAGGLHAENVTEAIRTVHPHGVDVCTGVRTDGRLDEAKLRAFVAAVRAT